MQFTSTIHKALLLAGISSSLAFGLEEYTGPNPVESGINVNRGFLNTEGKTIIFDQAALSNYITFAKLYYLNKHNYGEKAEGGANDSDGKIIGKSRNGKLESDDYGNLSILDQSLINMELETAEKRTLTLTNVTLEDFQLSQLYTRELTCNASDLTLNLRTTDLGQSNAIINRASESTTYTLNLKDSLTLDFYMTDAEAQSFAGGTQAITLTGITSLDNIDGNVAINFKNEAGDILFTGMDINPVSLDSTGNMTVNFTAEYIPEPSTATLSLLALAGLLARKRRKAA